MSKKIVRSFDVFDTLVARLHNQPQSTFKLVETKYPFPNFVELRMQAEQMTPGTLEEIYDYIGRSANLSQEQTKKLKEFELSMECEQVYPIIKNMKKIRDGDILISDTYYDENTIRMFLSKAGMDKNVRIFVSRDGKVSGKIWEKLKNDYLILLHLGDNPTSDYQVPLNAQVPTKLYQEIQYSKFEKLALEYNQEGLANLMRALRLQNPYLENTPHYEIWEEQSQINVPVLILYSLFLNEHCKKNGKTRLLFSSRDCCHLVHIFKKLFPNYESTYFYTSRDVYRQPSEDYIDYVKSVYTKDTVIVDGNGTGENCIRFFEKNLNTFPDYVVLVRRKTDLPITFVTSEVGWRIEQLNYDASGKVINYAHGKPIFAEPEYDLNFVYPAHECIKKCLELLRHYEFGEFNLELIKSFLFALDGSSKGIFNYIEHIC